MKNKDIPCCAADAMRHVKAVDVNGATIGLPCSTSSLPRCATSG